MKRIVIVTCVLILGTIMHIACTEDPPSPIAGEWESAYLSFNIVQHDTDKSLDSQEIIIENIIMESEPFPFIEGAFWPSQSQLYFFFRTDSQVTYEFRANFVDDVFYGKIYQISNGRRQYYLDNLVLIHK